MLTALRSILQAAAKSLGVERAAYAATIAEVWSEVVGADAAAYTRPSGLLGDILWVEVEPGPRAQDFTLQRTKVVASLNGYLGGPVIRDIRVRQRLGVGRDKVMAQRPMELDPPALSADDLAQIDRITNEIADEELRAAARQAMVSQWRWRKRQRHAGGGPR